MSWFEDAGLGLFVHWGHYASAGWEASWPLVGGAVSFPQGQALDVATYHANALRFKPEPNAPEIWIRAAADAGARYAVMTTRHHDGFSMWPTALSSHAIALGGYEGDPVGEFVAACRRHGLKVGFYYSLPDWHHPDYPAFTEAHKPYTFDQYPRPAPEAWNRFLSYVRGQLTELLTRYGTIDILWFDGGWERSPEEWDADGIEQLVRELQPDILINDRLPVRGDYATPEQFIPPVPPDGLWETCMTMNDSWGYNAADSNYKSATQLVHVLCEVVGRGGNLLLNVSPDGKGRLPPQQANLWDAIAEWTSRQGDGIFGTRPGLEPWQFYGPSTRRGNTLYAHLLMKPIEPVVIRGVPVGHVTSVKALATGNELSYETHIPILDMLLGTDPIGELRVSIPDEELDLHATTVMVEFDQPF